MNDAAEYLAIIEHGLTFICRHVQRIEGAGFDEFQTADNIGMGIESAPRAMEAYKRSLRPTMTTLPVGALLAV